MPRRPRAPRCALLVGALATATLSAGAWAQPARAATACSHPVRELSGTVAPEASPLVDPLSVAVCGTDRTQVDTTGGADFALSSTAAVPGLTWSPVALSGVTFPYDLHDAHTHARITDLVLTPSALARLLTGRITTWQDPAITATNPDHSLPDTAVAVLPAGQSAQALMLSTWLAGTAGADFGAAPSSSLPVPASPTVIVTSGPTVATVAVTDGSIGVADTITSAVTALPSAALTAADGSAVLPTPTALSSAFAAMPVGPSGFRGTAATGVTPGRWPLTQVLMLGVRPAVDGAPGLLTAAARLGDDLDLPAGLAPVPAEVRTAARAVAAGLAPSVAPSSPTTPPSRAAATSAPGLRSVGAAQLLGPADATSPSPAEPTLELPPAPLPDLTLQPQLVAGGALIPEIAPDIAPTDPAAPTTIDLSGVNWAALGHPVFQAGPATTSGSGSPVLPAALGAVLVLALATGGGQWWRRRTTAVPTGTSVAAWCPEVTPLFTAPAQQERRATPEWAEVMTAVRMLEAGARLVARLR